MKELKKPEEPEPPVHSYMQHLLSKQTVETGIFYLIRLRGKGGGYKEVSGEGVGVKIKTNYLD